MNEKELLELAAKAAGHTDDLFWSEVHQTFFYVERYDSGSEYQADAEWNPLTDDGDALRLAVKLGLVVNVWREARKVFAGSEEGEGYTEHVSAVERLEAATRRAIVRYAADIGRRM